MANIIKCTKDELKAIAKDINKLTLPHITKQARKFYIDSNNYKNANKLKKNDKAPFKHLLNERKLRKIKIEKQIEDEKLKQIKIARTKQLDYNSVLRKQKAIKRQKKAHRVAKLF